MIYEVADARTQQLALRLPKTTPAAVTIEGLGVKVKQYAPKEDGDDRVWTVLLGEARKGKVRLAVRFSQPLPVGRPFQAVGAGDGLERSSYDRTGSLKGFVLPVVRADGVANQSGAVAVEGSAELDIEIATAARRIDVGQLVDAEHVPGRRLLGAFGFADAPPPVTVDVRPHSGYRLPAAIVERAALDTHLTADGQSQTEVRLRLRTKAQFLELRLPEGAELWSIVLGQMPLRPQRDGDRLLISLPAAKEEAAGELKIVYALGVRPVALRGKVRLAGAEVLPARRARRGGRGDSAGRRGVAVARGGRVRSDANRRHAQHRRLEAAAAGPRGSGRRALCPGRRRASVLRHQLRGQAQGQHFDQSGVCKTQRGKDRRRRIGRRRRPTTKAPSDLFDKTAKTDDSKADEPMPKRSRQGREDDGEGGRGEVGAHARKDGRDGEPDFDRPEPPEAGKKHRLDLEGFRSLNIDLGQSADEDTVLTFRSLGEEPELVVTLAHRPRFAMLQWGMALAVLLFGVAVTRWPARRKVRLIVAAALVSGLIPVVVDSTEIVWLCNVVFFAACALVPYYLLAGAVRWAVARLRPRWTRLSRRTKLSATATAATVLLLCLAAAAAAAPPEDPQGTVPVLVPQKRDGPTLADILSAIAPPPVDVPDDAIIVPYDPAAKDAVEKADRLLVPYAKYVELWDRVHPDKKLHARPAPAPYAFAGAAYRATLADDEHLLLTGRLEIDVLTDGQVAIPLVLDNAVLAKAELDGKPARLSVAQPAEADGKTPLVLHATGKGRHALDVAVRLRVTRDGGWRVAKASIPAAPAAALTLAAPQAQTEVAFRSGVRPPEHRNRQGRPADRHRAGRRRDAQFPLAAESGRGPRRDAD